MEYNIFLSQGGKPKIFCVRQQEVVIAFESSEGMITEGGYRAVLIFGEKRIGAP